MLPSPARVQVRDPFPFFSCVWLLFGVCWEGPGASTSHPSCLMLSSGLADSRASSALFLCLKNAMPKSFGNGRGMRENFHFALVHFPAFVTGCLQKVTDTKSLHKSRDFILKSKLSSPSLSCFVRDGLRLKPLYFLYTKTQDILYTLYRQFFISRAPS